MGSEVAHVATLPQAISLSIKPLSQHESTLVYHSEMNQSLFQRYFSFYELKLN